MLRWTQFLLRCTLLVYFGERASCYAACAGVLLIRWTGFMLAARVCFNSVNTLHVTLRASVGTRYMLRCTRILYFGDQTPRYVARFCCSSVNTLHATLRASVVLLWTHFMLRCACVLYFGEHTSCYVVRVCFNSVNASHVMLIPFFKKMVNTLHVTLRTSVELRWTHFIFRCARMLYSGEHTSCYIARVCLNLVTTLHDLHVALHTSAARAHFMLRCARVCFNSVNDGECTSCYAARFWCTSVNALHVTLHVRGVFKCF